MTWSSARHSSSKSPPGKWARMWRPVRRANTPATHTAEAPVPQASVMPLPRSQVRMVTSSGEWTCTKWTLIRLGNSAARSSRGPTVASGTSITSRQNSTRCGLPIETQVIPGSRPQASCHFSWCQPARYLSSAKSTTCSCGATPGSATGISLAASRGRPMSTRTRRTLPRWAGGRAVHRRRFPDRATSTPAPVSIVTRSLAWPDHDRRHIWRHSGRRCRTFPTRIRRR